MRTVLYTGIHQKNNGIIAWEYNWENKLFSILFEKSEVQILLISVKVLMLLICLQQVNMMDRG